MSRHRRNYEPDDRYDKEHEPHPRDDESDFWIVIACLVALVMIFGIDKFFPPGI